MDCFHRAMTSKVGKGGWTCPCCEPAPKDRRKTRRYARRVLKMALRKGE